MKNLTIRARLALTMAFLGFLLALSVGFGLYGINATYSSAKDISDNSLPAVNALGISNNYIARARLALDRSAINPADKDAGGLIARANGFMRQSDEWYSKYDSLPRGADEDPLAKRVAEARAEMRQ